MAETASPKIRAKTPIFFIAESLPEFSSPDDPRGPSGTGGFVPVRGEMATNTHGRMEGFSCLVIASAAGETTGVSRHQETSNECARG